MTKANEFDDPAAFRRAMRADDEANEPDQKIKPYVYRPLDLRSIWYDTERRTITDGDEAWSGNLIQRFGEEFEKDIRLDGNEFFCTVEQPRRVSEPMPIVADGLVDLHLHDRGTMVFPTIYATEAEEATLLHPGIESQVVPNLAEPVWAALKKAWELRGN